MRIKWTARILLVIVAFVMSAGLTISQERPRGQIATVSANTELSWPLPASLKAYASIDGHRMKRHVDELVSISRKSRDAGNRQWGRIAGLPSGEEAQKWLASKFRQAGLEVRVDEFELRPQSLPKSWEVNVSGAGKTLHLTSASPIITFPNYMPSAEGDLNLETVWVGLGMASDFAGKDVRGKAVFIYSVPTPSSLIQSASWMGALGRAQEKGAAALFVVLAIPGNMSFVSHVQGLSNNGAKLPVFTVGLDDGEAVELLNAAVAPSSSIKTRVRWKVETLNGLRAANIVGVLPGQTNESIVMVSHLDAYFDGANDNAAGLASMLGVAEYFAGRPKEQRRRTMYFVGIADHHTGDAGGRRIHDAWQDVFSRTAVILNAEHVALGEPVWDRSWGSNVRPSLIKTNQLSPSWWGVHGSDRLANIIREDFAAFGVPTQIEPGGSAGQLRAVQWDAPSFYLHNKGVYYHSSADTADVVPAEGLRTATQAFAKIFDDINKLDLKDLRAAASVSPQSVQTACDRECLRGFITQYLNAMVAHDPKSLPLAANARFTEDTKTLPLGEGLWKGASGLRSYRQDFLDVREGMAASHVIVEEGGNPVMLGLRLKIVDKKLFEIETMVTRNRAEGAIFSIDALRTPKAAMNVVPDSSQRMSRAELIRIAEFYPAGLKVGGSFEAVQAPFAPDAYRLENGGMMAGPGARAGSENIRTQRIIAHPDVSYQIAAVDEELGIVLMRLDFGDTKSYGPGNALTCFEAFKVYGGQIHAVEAFIRIMPANTPSGWNYEVKKPK